MAERVFFGSVGGVARGKGLKGRGAEGRVLPWWLKGRGGGAVGCLEEGVAERRRDWAWPAGSGWAKAGRVFKEEGLVKGVAAHPGGR